MKQKTIWNFIKNKWYLLLIKILILDQITKYLVRTYIPEHASLTVIDKILYFTHTTNTGVSFGLFKGANFVFIIISLLVLAFFVYVKKKNSKHNLQFSLIFAGIIGNLIDRLLFGHVIDFIDFRIWPIFNIADMSISFGIIWLVLILWKKGEDLF